MEDIGENYFAEMVSGSFFQLVSDEFLGTWYIMHDLLHDLAESLSKGECFRLEDDNVTEIPYSIRPLSVSVGSIMKRKQIICKLQHLRTVLCIDPLLDDANDLFDKILRNMKKLRVLYLSFYNSSKLPESVGELKHLRYLNLIKTLVSKLPRSLCTLYHLQLLHLNHRMKSLPDTLCNLSKLRHLQGYHHLIPNIGRLTSLQSLNTFYVQNKKGYELRQLRDMNELGGSLSITNLENVIKKDELLESKLYQKSRLRWLKLAWSSENGMDEEDSLHLDIMEGLKPPPRLSGLEITGYKSGAYPSWLLEHSYFESLEFFKLANWRVLEELPPDIGALSRCSTLYLDNVPNLKTLSCLPAGITELKIKSCPLLMFVTKTELGQHDVREDLMKAEDQTSKLALILEADPSPGITSDLSEEYSSLSQLARLTDLDIFEHLQFIYSALEAEDKVMVEENVIKAWLCCHEQRIGLIYGRNIEQPLVPPSILRQLHLSSCSITDGALSFCLGDLTSLHSLGLSRIMTLTTLPSAEVFEHLTKLTELIIESCYGLRSLGGLSASTSIAELSLRTCPCLELADGEKIMPVSLESVSIYSCLLGADFFRRDLPNMNSVFLRSCRSSDSWSVGHLASLKEFRLFNFPDLCVLEGLSSLQLQELALIDIPKLTAECVSQLRVQRSLRLSSSVLLKHMLSVEGLTAPPYLSLEHCKDPSVSIEGSANFSSLKHLSLRHCKMESLPSNLKCLSSLERLDIHVCPNITSLPELPSSLQKISVWGCKELKNNCRAPDGESWPKISRIRWKEFS